MCVATGFRGIAVGIICVALMACAGPQRRAPPSLDEIVGMSNAGKPAEEITRELQDTGAVYPLTASQIVKLHEQGVAESVLDYLQNAYAASLREEALMQYDGYYWWPDCFYCYPFIVMPH